MMPFTFLSWEKFHTVTMKGLKVFVFYLAVLSLFRLVFILWLSDYWGTGTGTADVLSALWRGFRLSMQTAGALTLVSFLPGLLLHYLPGEYFFRSWEKAERTCWLALNGLLLGGLSILFVASFPFYRQFRMNFNQMLFNGANDDLMALFWTLMEQYALPLRLAGALLLACLLWHLLRWWLYGLGEKIFRPVLWPPAARYGLRLCYLGLLYLVCTLAVFGGSLGWQTAVDWENAGVTKDDFLNEAILDSPQAIYRAYELNRRMLACNGLDFTVEDIRLLAASLSGIIWMIISCTRPTAPPSTGRAHSRATCLSSCRRAWQTGLCCRNMRICPLPRISGNCWQGLRRTTAPPSCPTEPAPFRR